MKFISEHPGYAMGMSKCTYLCNTKYSKYLEVLCRYFKEDQIIFGHRKQSLVKMMMLNVDLNKRGGVHFPLFFSPSLNQKFQFNEHSLNK